MRFWLPSGFGSCRFLLDLKKRTSQGAGVMERLCTVFSSSKTLHCLSMGSFPKNGVPQKGKDFSIRSFPVTSLTVLTVVCSIGLCSSTYSILPSSRPLSYFFFFPFSYTLAIANNSPTTHDRHTHTDFTVILVCTHMCKYILCKEKI